MVVPLYQDKYFSQLIQQLITISLQLFQQYLNSKMTSSGIPRPLKFNSMQQFVFGQSGDFGQSYRSKSPKSGVFVIKPQQSFYDTYNVNNLLLQKVKKKHIQNITKNIVLNEQDFHPKTNYNQTYNKNTNFIQTIQPQHTKNNNFLQTNVDQKHNQFNLTVANKTVTPNTSLGFYPQDSKKSKQYAQNQLLFNFKKMAQQKKAKKKQFLQTIQQKLNMIQQQARDLQDFQFQQQQQLKQIQRIHNDIGRELNSNAFNGKITQKINQNLYEQQQNQGDQEYNKVKSLHVDMSPVEINHVLNNHFEENQKLFDQIIRIKSKSKENKTKSDWNSNNSPERSKTFQRSSNQSKGFHKTNISPKKAEQKKIVSATMKYPPKYNKR